MAQYVLIIYRNGGSVSPEVHQYAPRTLLGIGEYAVGKCQRGKVHFGNRHVGGIETLVKFAVKSLAPKDVQETALKPVALDSARICLLLVIDLVFLSYGIKNLLVLV